MLSNENYLPITLFNDTSLFYKASEIFRHGFLLDSHEVLGISIQLYSYYNFYVEIRFDPNSEEIKSIKAFSIDEAIDLFIDESEYIHAFLDLFNTNL